MGIIAGPALGGTWVAQRAMVTELAPKEKFGEYFGFSKLSGKVSASLGPLIWSGVFALYNVIAIRFFLNPSLHNAYRRSHYGRRTYNNWQSKTRRETNRRRRSSSRTCLRKLNKKCRFLLRNLTFSIFFL